MQYIFNGNLFSESDALFGKSNRAFQLGDIIKEYVKVSDGNLLLWEEHYFNLMASMRIFRMKIPLTFTQEFLEEEIKKVAQANSISNAKIKLSVFRNTEKINHLTHTSISYLIEVESENEDIYYSWKKDKAEIDVFKDYSVNPTFFAQVNSHKPEEIIAQAYLQENELYDLVLLNPEKRIARTLLGSLFLIKDNVVKTPKLSEGGIRSVTRNHLCQLLTKSGQFLLEEAEIYPFELQKSDELFICIESEGILSISQNRKKSYETHQTSIVADLLCMM